MTDRTKDARPLSVLTFGIGAGIGACAAFAVALCIFLSGIEAADAQTQPDPALLTRPARAWAVDCAANEILVIQHPDSYLRYRMHVVDEKGDQMRDQIETRDGSVARLILRDGRPLTPDEDAAERDRLNDLVASPSTFYRHIHREQENKKLGGDLLKLMPDAMIWTYAPGQPQAPIPASAQDDHTQAVSSGGRQIVLDFAPNPAWSPPSLAADALTGLRGRIWIDARSHCMIHLEGELFHSVNIGWGMLAHIYPGGTVTLQQTNAGGQRWIVDHIVEQLTVRALMLKTVRQRLVFDTAGFQPVPAMPYAQAIKLLLDTPLSTQSGPE